MELADWDRYWSEVLAENYWREAKMESHQFHFTSLRYLKGLKQRESHRILLVGNGISPEPHGWAYAGCDVTVLEVSAVANHFVASLTVTPDLLANMFVRQPVYPRSEPYSQEDRDLVSVESRPGGTLTFATADLFRFEPVQAFDAIFSRRAYQGFAPAERGELARRFFRWLQPKGLAFVEMLNVIRNRELFEQPFRDAGFNEIDRWPQAPCGERTVLFWHGTG
jgi:hypothetical protein